MTAPDSTLLFATAFYHAAGRSPNAWTISEEAKLRMYYRCMIVCYASLRRLYPGARLALYTNRELPEPFGKQLGALGVDAVQCPSRYVDDTAFSNGFPGCLYTLDVIEHLAREPHHDFSRLILLDSDCVVRRRLDGMLGAEQAIHAYEPGYPVNMVANGQSRASLTLALSYFSGERIAPPIPLYGGEFYVLPANVLPELATRIDAFWAWMKSDGIRIFGDNLTEEHVMSVVLAQFRDAVSSESGMVKRIWTADAFSTVDGSESDIPVWHLPSEKKKGFVSLYQSWLDRDGFDRLSDEDFRTLVDNCIPLHAVSRGYPGKSMLLRLRNSARVLVTGRI